MTATRVVVADDHPTFRRGLRALIDSLPDIDLVGEAADGEAAVTQAADLMPDVVMDLNMPGLNGVEATRRVVAANPSVAVLIVTMLDEDESVFAAMRAGARGYVVKAQTPMTCCGHWSRSRAATWSSDQRSPAASCPT